MTSESNQITEEQAKKIAETEKELEKISMSLSGLGLFEVIEKLYEWSSDGYPEKGLWSHIGEAIGLLGTYWDISLGSLSNINFEKPTIETDKKSLDIGKKLMNILKLLKAILCTIIGNMIKMALVMLKTLYDTCMLMLKTLGQTISAVGNEINAMIKLIGNAIALIKSLFVKKENDKYKNPWDAFCEMFDKWLNEKILPMFTWENILDILWQMILNIWDMFVAAVEPYVSMIKNLWNEIKSYAESLSSLNPLKEALMAFLDAFFGPILSMIEEIITLFFNMIKNYNVSKNADGTYNFDFTSNLKKDSKGRFILCSTVINGTNVQGTYIDGSKTIKFQSTIDNLNWTYGKNNVEISPSIPNYLNSLKLKSKEKVVGNYKLGTKIALEEEFSFDVWGFIDKYIDVAKNQIFFILKKLESLLQNLVNSLIKPFIPHLLMKSGSNIEEFPKNLAGFRLIIPEVNINITEKEAPSPKIITIVSDVEIKEGVTQQIKYNCSWDGKDVYGTLTKNGDKLKFNIPNYPLTLMYLYSFGESCILITEEQYKIIKQLKDLLNLPVIAFNSIALAIFGSLYISTIQIKTALNAAKSILKVVGLEFTSIIDQFDKVMASSDDTFIFENMSTVFEWPKWEDFSGNPLTFINFNIDFNPITTQFSGNVVEKLPQTIPTPQIKV